MMIIISSSWYKFVWRFLLLLVVLDNEKGTIIDRHVRYRELSGLLCPREPPRGIFGSGEAASWLASNLHAAPTPKNNRISPLMPPATQDIYLGDLMTWLWFFRQLNYSKTNMVLWNTKFGKEKWKQKRITNKVQRKMKRTKTETHLSWKMIIHGTYYGEALLPQASQEPPQFYTCPTNNAIQA